VDVLVTGGNGLLGHHLVPMLQERGDRVRVLALPTEDTSWLEERGVAAHRGDVQQPETLVEALRDVEGVVHLAAIHGVWASMEQHRAVNVAGTQNVCRAALAAGVRRFVHVSSWTVYGMGLGRPADETFPLEPLSDPYPVSKAEADKLVQRMVAQNGLPAVIIRPGTIFGPGDQVNYGRIADRLGAGRGIIIGSGDNALPMVYVTDVARGLLLALDNERAVGQAYNITNDRPFTQHRFFEAIADELGVRSPRLHVPYVALYAAASAAEFLAKATRSGQPPPLTRLGVMLFGTENRHPIEKARGELGYAPEVPLAEGIRLAAEWYRSSASRTGLSAAPATH
jgi:nucleoside-diphosphate-sugar epimerase